MEILVNAGQYMIFAPSGELLAEDVYKHIEYAGRTAYRSEDKITTDSAEKFVRMIIKSGHESVLEHAGFSVRFDNISRGFTHELVRHRLCAFTQESTRYVNTKNLRMVLPPDCDLNQEIALGSINEFSDGRYNKITIGEIVLFYEEVYRGLRDQLKWKPEDARQFLPNGVAAAIVCTTNFREWRHIFRMRCARVAHWEIRGVMLALLADCYRAWPAIFEDVYREFFKEETEDAPSR
jgi:thymidylate synthase (FAD)